MCDAVSHVPAAGVSAEAAALVQPEDQHYTLAEALELELALPTPVCDDPSV
ncbi:MAG: hypothetical protein JOZ65_04985 [Chloroflexi bacterium]|nr:hypothetical protein [Chloroflexota bacterium]